MQMRAVDSTAYREELQGAAGHTVTFARAPDLGGTGTLGPSSRDEATQVGGLGDDAKTLLGPDAHGDMPTPTALTGLPLPRRGWLVPVGVAGLVLLLVGSGGVYYFRHARLLTEAERSQLVTPEPGPQLPEQAPPVPPVVEPLPPQRTEAPPEPTEDKTPRRRPVRAPRPETEAEVAEKRRIEVDRKFKEVRAEYVGFKQQFGARLEDRWQGILSDIALGRRDQSVSDALDALRRDMRKVRSERKPETPGAALIAE
jgi:hypothetical protein